MKAAETTLELHLLEKTLVMINQQIDKLKTEEMKTIFLSSYLGDKKAIEKKIDALKARCDSHAA